MAKLWPQLVVVAGIAPRYAVSPPPPENFMITVRFNVQFNTLQVISERFYGSDDPTINSVTALKDNGQSTRSKANPSMLSSLKVKM